MNECGNRNVWKKITKRCIWIQFQAFGSLKLCFFFWTFDPHLIWVKWQKKNPSEKTHSNRIPSRILFCIVSFVVRMNLIWLRISHLIMYPWIFLLFVPIWICIFSHFGWLRIEQSKTFALKRFGMGERVCLANDSRLGMKKKIVHE